MLQPTPTISIDSIKQPNHFSPKFNSLRANILYHQLRLEQKSGRYNKKRFIDYLKLPRRLGYVNKEIFRQAERVGGLVNLGANYSSFLFTTPIGNEESLVRDYLQYFLKNDESFNSYQPYLTTNFLRDNFARAKILAGKGEPEQWVGMLSPAAYKELISRTDLTFSPMNQEYFGPDEDVKLSLQVKNVDKLIVKIFEINTLNYYRKIQTRSRHRHQPGWTRSQFRKDV